MLDEKAHFWFSKRREKSLAEDNRLGSDRRTRNRKNYVNIDGQKVRYNIMVTSDDPDNRDDKSNWSDCKYLGYGVYFSTEEEIDEEIRSDANTNPSLINNNNFRFTGPRHRSK